MNGTLSLEAVSLQELVSQAELLTRVDRKYLLSGQAAREILESAGDGMRVLEIAGKREFAYDSVYFDTPDHLSYRLTAQRRRRRFKLRTRSYLDTGTTFLELKTKSGRGATVKQRIAHSPDDRARLTREGRAHMGLLLQGQGHDPRLIDRLHPSLVSRYHRTTLLLPDGSRATVDTHLAWSDGTHRGVSLPHHVIIESKSAGPPSRLDLALWRAGHRPSGMSKFGTGTAALHPELPSNKWARTLRGPFSTARTAPTTPISIATGTESNNK